LGQLVAAAFAALAFWPQAGVLGQDLYYANSVDLDPAAGATLDPFCGHRTYGERNAALRGQSSDGRLSAPTVSAALA
jgi:hypothetical protein